MWSVSPVVEAFVLASWADVTDGGSVETIVWLVNMWSDLAQ